MSFIAISPKSWAHREIAVRSSWHVRWFGLICSGVYLGIASTLAPVPAMAAKIPTASDRVSTEAAAKLKLFHDYIRDNAVLNFKVRLTVRSSLNGEITRGTASFLTRAPNFFRVEVAVRGRRYDVRSDGQLITISRPANDIYAQQPTSSTLLRSMYTVAGLTNISGRMLDFFWASAATRDVRIFSIPSAQVGGRACDGIRIVRFEETFDVWLERSGKPLPCRLESRRIDGSAMSVNSYTFEWLQPPAITSDTFRFMPSIKSREVDALDLQ